MYKLALALLATSAVFAQIDRTFPFKYPKIPGKQWKSEPPCALWG